MFFHEIFEIKTALQTLIVEKHATLGIMARGMQDKFNKYWGDVEKINELLIVAAIIDPRYKLKLLRICFKTYGDPTFTEEMCARSVQTLRNLFEAYNGGPNVEEQPYPIPITTTGIKSEILSGLMEPDSSEQGCPKTEVDYYLNDALEKYLLVNFDVLAWWKLNGHKYPILSLIAKDILSIQVSTVASESAFSCGGRIVDLFRSSLDPKMVEALMCARDWFRGRAPIMPEECKEHMENLAMSESIVEGMLVLFDLNYSNL